MTEPVPLVGGILAAFAALVGLIVWVVKRDTKSREALERVQSQAFTHTMPRLADDFKTALAELRKEHRDDREAWRAEMKEAREANERRAEADRQGAQRRAEEDRAAAERRERMLLDEIRAIRNAPAPGDKG